MSLFDITLFIETSDLHKKLIEVWRKLTDIYSRDLHLAKESSIAIDREIESLIHRLNEKIPPLRTELEELIRVIEKRKKDLQIKFF